MILPDTIKKVLASGGSLVVDGNQLLPNYCLEVVTAAVRGGGHLTVKNCSYLPDYLIKISVAAKGHVTFDMTK